MESSSSSSGNGEGIPDNRSCTLLTLPSELRNMIYEYVFYRDLGASETVDLLACQPPPQALTQTCRQLRAETKYMYRDANDEFWKLSHFTITFTASPRIEAQQQEALKKLAKMNPADLALIRLLSVRSHHLISDESYSYHLKDSVWRDHDASTASDMFVPREKTEELRAAGFFVKEDWWEATNRLYVTRAPGRKAYPAFSSLENERLEEAIRIADRTGLTYPEVARVVRDVSSAWMPMCACY